MEPEIEILRNEAKVIKVRVNLPKRNLGSDPNLQVETHNVISLLSKEGLDVSSWVCVRADNINNYATNAKMSGVWKFKKISALAPVVSIRTNKDKTANKAEVTDSTQTKPTRKRRSRGTRKKDAPNPTESKLLGTENLE